MDQAVGHCQQQGNRQVFDVIGKPETRPVGHLEDADKPDEPATPDRDPCRMQNDVRVGQGAWCNPLLYGVYADLQQAKAPGLESPTWMRFDIPDRILPFSPAISRCLPLTTYISSS